MVFLYVLFALSVFFPLYTYLLYPLLLKSCKEKDYISRSIEPKVSIIVIGPNPDSKIPNVKQCDYPDLEIITGDYDSAFRAKGEIIVFTDTETKLDTDAIRRIVEPFADNRISCVVGQQTNPNGNSSFWKYENHIKKLESCIGCVSGANNSLFAVRKGDLPVVPGSVINKPFYIVTKITEKKIDVVFCENAKTYEEINDGTNFKKHVKDAAGYWQALLLFPRLLFFKHGSFVFVSHRVLKWFVWLNLLVLFATSGVLSLLGSFVMTALFISQTIGYSAIFLLGKRLKGSIGRFFKLVHYFIMLNVAYLVGLFC